MSKICASCLDFNFEKIVKSNDLIKPKWLIKKDHVRTFIENSNVFTNYFPEPFNVKMKINIGKKNCGKKILYWAANEKKFNDVQVKDAKTSYGDFSNSGVMSVDKNGEVLLKFNCPQIYSTIPVDGSKPKTYFRHLHFVISNEKKDKWMPQIYTKIVVCKFGYDYSMKLLKTGYSIFINALTCEYYGKDHIPNSYNLTNYQVKKMNQNEVFSWFETLVKLHYPKIYSELKAKRIQINEIPIMTYCAHDKCNASRLLLEELMKKGMVNVNEFSGGMKEYRKHLK